MQGKVLKFDSDNNSGFISGHDGNRYQFVRLDWAANEHPKEGQDVDFDIDGKNAKEIIVLQKKPQQKEGVSPKSRLVAFLLCTFVFTGVLGFHRFYVGKVGSGILMICTLGGLGIWFAIDWFLIVFGKFRDAENKLVSEWNPEKG